jgi:uncharacterized protein (DUF697 family)
MRKTAPPPALALPVAAETGRVRRVPKPARAGRAGAIVREYMLLSAASALVPDPVLCMTAVTGAHLEMLADLSKLYRVPFSPKTGRVLLVGAGSGAVTYVLLGRRCIRRLIFAFPAMVPLWFLGGSILAGTFTHLLGHAMIRHFEKGGDFYTFDWHAFRHEIAQKLGLPRPARVIPAAGGAA